MRWLEKGALGIRYNYGSNVGTGNIKGGLND